MEQIGVRELRQQASHWLKRVAAGESFQVTEHGRPVAMLVPLPETEGLAALIAAGRVTPGKGHLRDLGPPLPLRPGATPPSKILEALRADER